MNSSVILVAELKSSKPQTLASSNGAYLYPRLKETEM